MYDGPVRPPRFPGLHRRGFLAAAGGAAGLGALSLAGCAGPSGDAAADGGKPRRAGARAGVPSRGTPRETRSNVPPSGPR
ncbi:hypothetical protein [Streptomyces decoyicus]|uniref:hypothetical protein n=1 Tax=Streptomyces decoyicus TaxID=249567 RepID=UPI0033A19D7C